LHYYFALLFYFEKILYTLFKDIVFIIFVYNIFKFLKALN